MSSQKFLKKIEKRAKKYQHTIYKETGVLCANDPTKNLAICNVGQINGLTEDTIVRYFGTYGTLQQIVLVPGRSCCFLSYASLNSAIDAFSNLNGVLNIAQYGKPVYLSYTETLPDIKDGKNWGTLPDGLILLRDFITESEENDLMGLCKFNVEESCDSMRHRQVKHFGYEFRYDTNNVDKDKPLNVKIPKDCNFLFGRLQNCHSTIFSPDQLTVNYYKPGQGIPSHVDTHSAFEDPILSLSLGSDVVMEFKKNDTTTCVLLPRRSLLIMSGESRYDWTHGIVPKKYDFYYTSNECKSFERSTRISFTFRKILRGACTCKYKTHCDSYNKQLIIDKKTASILENQHVYHVYEDIANHFSDTRHKPWPNVLQFIQKFKPGDILIDVGCGNGKYFGHRKDIFELGMDRSFKLNEFCKNRGFQTLTGNCLNIPLKDEVADGVISIAVIHHLATEERRLQALLEIVRVLRKEGLGLVYVWAKEQVKDNEKSTYIKQDRKNRKAEVEAISAGTENTLRISENVCLPVHTNRKDFKHNDVLVPWKLKDDEAEKPQTFLRFYHVFENGELDKLCSKISNITIIKSYYDQGNCCVMFKKNNSNSNFAP